MSELDSFIRWATRSVVADASLIIRLEAYTKTFPGRTLRLLAELAEAAINHKEEKPK